LKKIFRYIIFVLLGAFGDGLYAQQLPTYTQYLNNGFLINPSLAGSDGYTSFNTTYKKQWIGFENSPTTYSISGQTRMLSRSYKIVHRNVKKNSVKPSTKGRVGLGGFVFNDRIGQVNQTGMSFAYAYHIYIRRSQLSFGLSAQAFQYKIDVSKLDFGSENPADPIRMGGDMVNFIPDANAGVFWTGETYFAGFSANQLFQSVFEFGKLDRQYYFMGGYRFAINRELEIEPSTMITTTDRFIPQADLSARLIYQNEYWAGFSYRTGLLDFSPTSVSTMVGARVEKFYFGLAYDYSLSSIRKRSLGSVEIVLSLKFGSSARRYRWINRF
jgi:type IX secretion system PorP/SprF family membrane protein